jgi:hypothetical protein
MSTETLAPASEVDRILAHLPCLERAAADPSAPTVARRAVREQIAEDRVALALLGADLPRTDSERNGTHHG